MHDNSCKLIPLCFFSGGRIDHAHHDSLAHLALDETVEYSKAVKKAKSLTSESDTLIVVSADHAHTMSVSGYPSRGNDILSTVDTARGMDGVPYTTISYANGKANSIFAGGRVDVTKHEQFLSSEYYLLIRDLSSYFLLVIHVLCPKFSSSLFESLATPTCYIRDPL